VTPAELAAAPEWRRIFETDPVLNALEAARYDEATDRMLLAGIFHWPLRVGKLPVYPLTPARWSLLWLLGNGYTRAGASITAADMEQFLFVLTHDLRKLDVDFDDLAALGAGWGPETDLAPKDLHTAIDSIIRTAFSPLAMLPPEAPGEEAVRYDGDWLVGTAALAARESGETLDFCKFEMSLGEVHALMVDCARRTAAPDYANRIRRQPPAEAEAAIIRRVRELQKEYIAGHGADGDG